MAEKDKTPLTPPVDSTTPPPADPVSPPPADPVATPPKKPTSVLARLGSKSPVGKLMVGNVALTATDPALISAEDFERLEAEYGLEEVKGKKDK